MFESHTERRVTWDPLGVQENGSTSDDKLGLCARDNTEGMNTWRRLDKKRDRQEAAFLRGSKKELEGEEKEGEEMKDKREQRGHEKEEK